MLKAVVLDMDGLMVDSEPFWRQAEMEVFATVGLHLTLQQCIDTTGIRIDEIAKMYYRRKPWSGPSPEEVAEKIIQRVIELVGEKGEALPGVLDLVKTVKAKGLPLALASSSPLRLINAVLDKFGIRDQFQIIHSAEFDKYGKPHPAVYVRTVEALGLPSDTCVTFEDTMAGTIAAKAAGMKVIAVPQAESEHDERFILADRKLKTLENFDWQILEEIFS
ncbi:MAG: hexitol phosphatase HxpB [Lentisphaeraceae bacterium]|nr:hexitol phosphatase HxpB [Lentisphaeraceae bacterium]